MNRHTIKGDNAICIQIKSSVFCSSVYSHIFHDLQVMLPCLPLVKKLLVTPSIKKCTLCLVLHLSLLKRALAKEYLACPEFDFFFNYL